MTISSRQLHNKSFQQAAEMSRHELWRQNYRINRDLDHLTPEELSERLHDCVNNMRTRTVRGKLGLLPMDQPAAEMWMSLFTEVLEECSLRGYPYPGPISNAGLRSSLEHAFDPIPDMDRVLVDFGLTTKPFLLKYGEMKWLKPSFERGRFRIASSSYYDSYAHNHARRDTELHRYTRLNPRNPHAVDSARSSLSEGSLSETGWARVSCPTDYYLFSLSASYSSRLFGDFASTACLVIHEPRRFVHRVMGAVAAQLPGWNIEFDQVTYYDPVRVNPAAIIVPKFKPFKHAYQDEMRIVCLPPNRIDILSSIEIDVGSLADCATLVDLSSHPPPSLPYDPTEEPVQPFGNTKPESVMVQHLPNVARMQGIIFNKEGSSHKDWHFQIQYTDNNDVWHELRVPMLDGLYLLNLLETAEKEQHLSLWNRK